MPRKRRIRGKRPKIRALRKRKRGGPKSRRRRLKGKRCKGRR